MQLFMVKKPIKLFAYWVILHTFSGIFFSILGRGPRAFQIGKISGVNSKLENLL